MQRGLLAGAAMGGVFCLVPALVAGASLVWLTLRATNRSSSTTTRVRLRVAWGYAREPLQTAALLVLAGVVLVGFVTGDLGARSYAEVSLGTIELIGESVVDWRDATSSGSIAVRGFGFILLGSCLLVGWLMVRYYQARWPAAELAEKRVALGGGRPDR